MTQQPPVDRGASATTEPDPPPARWPLWVGSAAVPALVAIGGAILLPVPNLAKGLLATVLMLGLIAIRTPVSVALIVSSVVGILGVGGWSTMVSSIGTMPFRQVTSWQLAVLPMFVLMGLVLWRGGATEKVYDAANAWLSWLPGGLAVTTNFAGAGLAAVSGSTLGITYAVARIGIPEMLKAGYDKRLATGAVLMAGTGGQLIPPSILMVVYAGIATVPVGPQLLAGLVPGLVLALAYGVSIVGLAVLRPDLAPKAATVAHIGARERVASLAVAWPVPLLMFVVLGGLFGGVFTATEAGAYGALGAIIIALWYVGPRRIGSVLAKAVPETVAATASILILLVGAGLFTRMLTLTGVARWLTERISTLEVSAVVFMLVLAVFYILLGMVVDPLTMMLLTVPILLPVLETFDISAMWFGVFIVLLGELGVLTPPVGLLTFIVHRVVQDPEVNRGTKISLTDVFAGAVWFLPAAFAVLLAMVFFPEMVEWLPNLARR